MACDFMVDGWDPDDGSFWFAPVHLLFEFPAHGDLVKVTLAGDDIEVVVAGLAALLPAELTVETLLAATNQVMPQVDLDAVRGRIASSSRFRRCAHGETHIELHRLKPTLGVRTAKLAGQRHQRFLLRLASASSIEAMALVVREQLNRQRCLLLTDATSTEMWIAQFCEWFASFAPILDAVPHLALASDEQLRIVADAYTDLVARPVGIRSNGQIRRVGPTTASRLLSLLFPSLVVSWTDARRTALSQGRTEIEAFVIHLQEMRELARCLEAQCGGEVDGIAKTVGCPEREAAWVIEMTNRLRFPLW